jgi:NitT/TauT family transport system substrate-binding protein
MLERPARGAFLRASAAAAFVAALPRRLGAAPQTLVTVGSIPSDTAAVVEYAFDRGEFKAAGLDVRISILNNGPAVAAAVVGGSLNAGAMNSGSIAVARARGLPLKYFAPCAVETPETKNDVIMVRKDSAIRSGADLNGKTVGIVAVKTMQYAAAMAWVDKHGGDSKTVKFIETPFPEMAAALDHGRVDATIPSEPFASMDRANHRVLGYTYDALPPRFMIFGFAATEQWLATNGDVALRFASAIRRTASWANTHHDETAAMLVQHTKVDPSIAHAMARATYGTSLEPALLQPVVDIMVRYGLLQQPMDAAELIWRPAAG